jgi:hypothetical protein
MHEPPPDIEDDPQAEKLERAIEQQKSKLRDYEQL